MSVSSFSVSAGQGRKATHWNQVRRKGSATLVHIADVGKTPLRAVEKRGSVLESPAPTVSETGPQIPRDGERPAGGGPSGPPPDEFAGIPSRGSRHPVIAAAAALLAGYLVFQIRADVQYALSPAAAVDLGDARRVAVSSGVPANRYVRLSGRGDRESALILDTQGSWDMTQFFRLLGTDDRVFVKRAPDPLPVELAEHDVFTGRLVPFRDLSFEESIRRHFSSNVSATHFFAPEALPSALGQGGPITLTDRTGQKVTLAPEDELTIDSAPPGQVRIELPGDRWPELAKAKALITDRGGQVLSAETTVLMRQAVVATFPDDRRAGALAALSDLDRRVRIGPARTTTRVRLSDLRRTPEGLVAHPKEGAEVVLPPAQVVAVRSVAAVRIPDGAWLLLEGDRPRDHLKTVVIAVLLVGFALVNLLGLRPRRRAATP
jgi:hypothetical protein